MGAKFLVRVALLLIVAASAFPGVVAAEDVPGDACSPANISRLSGGPETSGKVYLMTCQSGAWVRIMETATSGNVGIGTATPRTSLDLGGKTDALVLQTGTTGQRPASPVEGMVRYNSTTPAMEGYVNGAWMQFQMVGSTPAAFTFTNQTGVSTSATISSNAVTLSGFSGTLTATCGTGCTAIARNGTWGSTAVAGFASGDTIAIRQTSSASLNTATTATVTVGTTTSATWTVTTTSSTPNAFSFTDQTGVAGGLTITSNAVTLGGFTGTLNATCNTGCTNIAINGTWQGTSASGVASGNTITIQQKAAAAGNTPTTASVTVGATVSGTWTVTTGSDPCDGTTTPGYVCPNGMVYAGYSPDTSAKMYTTPCDAGQSWNGSACTGTRSAITWNNGSIVYLVTGYGNDNTGQMNTAGLAALSDAASPYKAAVYCHTLSFGGYSDWYLPAINELSVLYANNAAIGGFNTASGTYYWSSSEASSSRGSALLFSDGTVRGNYGGDKQDSFSVRCVRR